MTPRSVRSPLVSSLAVASILGIVGSGALGCGASGPGAKSASGAEESKSACVGGLCLHPDHVVATKVAGSRGRCLIIAWDGTDSLPPTAHIAVSDDSPGARPGVFAAIDMPSLREGFSYPIASDPTLGKPGSASVFSVRVDPGVRFADQRFADGGDVKVLALGAERVVMVTAKWSSGKEETASFVIPKAYNGCTSPADLP